MNDKAYGTFLDTIKTRALIKPGARVLAALSGGSDSVVMLHMLTRIRDEYSLTLEAAHINHMIRPTAGRDERFCRELCERWGVPLHIRRIDVPALSREKKIGLEECGRRVRYEAFEEIMAARSLRLCATAHNRDDNAETMILNFVRGASARGMSGIPFVRGALIRPILDIKKADVLSYAKSHGLAFVTDETNADTSYTRNFVRGELMPLIERMNPSFADAAARSAALFSRDEAYLAAEAKRALSRGEDFTSYIKFPLEYLRTLPEAVLSRVVRLSCVRVCGAEPDFTATERAMSAIYEKSGNYAETLIGGAALECAYGGAYFIREIKPESFAVSVDKDEDTLYFPAAGLKISYKVENYSINFKKFNGILYMDYDIMTSEAFFTERKEGDVFEPFGGAGKRSVKRFMQDNRIPSFLRGRLPVLRCGGDILWVCPVMRPARKAAVTKDTKRVICFRVSKTDENNTSDKGAFFNAQGS
ncbi:MAG: tRNA lysidine(34) synthetase TilS [Clostridia bacterium]|nr:tRNA lysidine(34) synthetase TilS [Clostridia bacterium]